jgi:glycosyltransferase involved in cell wall biosynthesis
LQNGLATEMIYWGVDTEFYTVGDKNYKEKGNWYLWLSRFHPDKGLDLALDMADWLGIELKVAGSMSFSDHELYGKQYLERIRGMKNVEYVDLPMDSTHHEVKRELYRNAKAFLYPVQYFECFGMVVIEAMACGCPVITTPNGAMPELVNSGSSGFICHNKEDFAQTLQKLIPSYTNSSSLHEGFNLWKHSRMQAEKFSIVNSAIAYEKLFLDVIGGKSW